MILSLREQAAVRDVASSYSVDGNPEELIDAALAAICLGQAEDMAYAVCRSAGIEFVGPFIWGKNRRDIVNATQARELITQAKKDQTYEGPIPDDDGKAIEEANALVELATDAWNDAVTSSEVETILRMAASFEENGDAPAAPAPKQSARPSAEPDEPVQDAKDLTGTAAAAFRTDDLQELAKTEPWEDYAKEKVEGILNGINAAIETYDLEDMYELLRNIWAYESMHKNRRTVIDAVDQVHQQIVTAQRAQGDTPYAPANQIERPQAVEEDAAAEEAEPDEEPEDEAEPEADEGDEEDVEPDADDDERGEAAEALPEEPADEEQPVAEAAPERPDEAPVGDDDPYRQLVTDVTDEIKRERVHVPDPPTEVAPQIPWDWTKISDQELQRLHSVFSGYGYYVDYKLSRENRLAMHCKQAADEMARALLVAAAKEHAKSTPVSILEAEVESDENVKLWRSRQRRHEAFAAGLRSERDGYYKILEGLSRHESMRMDEWQRSGGKPGSILRRAGGK